MNFISRSGHPNAQKSRPSPGDGHKRSTSLGIDIHTGQEVYISSPEERLQIVSLFGATGAGKSTLLKNLIHANIQKGDGVCVLDPHGDLIRSVIAGIPVPRLKDTTLLDVSDADFPVGLNLVETPQPGTIKTMALAASSLSHIFSKIWGLGPDTPRLLMVLRAVVRTLLETPGTTIAEAMLLFTSDTVRAKMVANLTNQEIIAFWEGFNRRSQREKDDLVASCANKIAAFLDEPMIKHIIGQSKSTLDFRRIMDEGKILLVSLSPQFEEISDLIGSVIISRILLAAFSRAELPEHQRLRFYLYADEWHRYSTPDFSTLLSEARKFALATTLATQTLEQLDDINRAAALQAGSLVVFRVSGEDSKVLAKSYDAEPTSEIIGQEPIRAPVADVIFHLVRRGHNDPRVAKFAQNNLSSLEKYAHTKMEERTYASYHCFSDCLVLSDLDVERGRKLLNAGLYAAMSERNPNIAIAAQAIYVLATAQANTMEWVFSPYLITESIEFCGPHRVRAFRDGMASFGTPAFLTDHAAAFVQRQHNNYTWMAERIVSMLTELRYVLSVLAKHPILVDTGQYVPQYRQRTYHDQENLVANELSQMPNFHAKVRLVTGEEHTIRTHPAPLQLCETEIDKRIRVIKKRMLLFGMTKPYAAVEAEIRKRQTLLRQQADADLPPPPPTPTNGRRRRRPTPRP